MNQAVAQNLDYLPGACPEPSRRSERNSADSGVSSHEFTGKACPERSRREQDPETALAHTQFRQYSSNLGRWMTPDPAGRRAVSLANPQTWNRYSYVGNNALNSRDPLGLCPAGGCPTFSAAGGGNGNCSSDGIDVPCWLAAEEVVSGASVPCRNNACQGVNQFGLPVRFIATLAGSGYGCQLSSEFSTQQSAGMAGASCAMGLSSAYGTEYGGDIYSIDSNENYSFRTVAGTAGTTPLDPTDIPDGTEFAGIYHTHAGAVPANEQFSVVDIFINTASNFPSHLGTPGGRILMYDPTLFSTSSPYFGCVLQGSTVSGISGVRPPIPSCP